MPFVTQSRGPAGIAVTIAVHAGLAAVALIGLRIAVPPPPPPPIVTTNYDAPKAPPVRRIEPRTHEQRIDTSVLPPIIETVEPPTTDRTTATLARDPGIGDPGGTTDGRVEPVKPEPPVGITRSASIDTRFRTEFQPLYPPASQRIGEEGTVVVRVVVGIDGRVVRATVARSSGFPRLDAAAVERALTRWRFVPASRDGQPVEAERELPVTFRLMQG